MNTKQHESCDSPPRRAPHAVVGCSRVMPTVINEVHLLHRLFSYIQPPSIMRAARGATFALERYIVSGRGTGCGRLPPLLLLSIHCLSYSLIQSLHTCKTVTLGEGSGSGSPTSAFSSQGGRDATIRYYPSAACALR